MDSIAREQAALPSLKLHCTYRAGAGKHSTDRKEHQFSIVFGVGQVGLCMYRASGRRLAGNCLQYGRRGLELLIRKLLQLPSRPAVLMLNLWIPGYNRYSFWQASVTAVSPSAPAALHV